MGHVSQNTHKILDTVNHGRPFAKWGKMDEIPLNEVISVKKVKIGGVVEISRHMSS